MTKTTLLAILLVLLSFTAVPAQQIEAPKLTPTPATDSQQRLINEGVVLHDRGDYDGAIARYEEVLRENPTNDLVMMIEVREEVFPG